MSEIPEDIMAAAREACGLCGITPTSDMRVHAEHVAALAIQTERTRALSQLEAGKPAGHVAIAHDGFSGDIIGHYITREGKRGVVVQQDGTRVVHVYGEKWLSALASPSPAPEAEPVDADRHEFVADWYWPARCQQCGGRREHPLHTTPTPAADADAVIEAAKEYRIVFDGFPSPDGPRFIEVEDASGRSIKAGEWRKRPDGLSELVIKAGGSRG